MSHRAALGIAAALFLSACGASPWVKARGVAEKIQEESVEGQKAASLAVVKVGWLYCNGLSVLYAERVQKVLDLRAAEAKGEVGAAKALSVAEYDAEVVRPFLDDACSMAKRLSAKLTPSTATPSPTTPLPPPVSPAMTPTGGAVPGAAPPSATPPAGAVPPVGVPSQPATPVVP